MAEIIYVGDPMCSWCWGISPDVTKLKEKYADKLGFRMLMGGLRPFTTEPMDAKMKKFLFHHWEKVSEATGQPFKYGLLDKEGFVYDTEPPARAVVAVRMLKPKVAFDFFKAVQYAFYADNRDTNDITTYLTLLPQFGIDGAAFEQLFKSDKARKSVREEYKIAQSMGVRSFPTVLLHFNDRWHLIGNGYQTFEDMDNKLAWAVQQ